MSKAEDKLKIMLWGAGKRGQEALALLGKENVHAFIDRDSRKVGSFVEGIPVISPEEYAAHAHGCLLVVTMFESSEAIQWLDNRRLPYILYDDDLPWEFWQGYCDVEEYPWHQYPKENSYGIWGGNFLSLRIYAYMRSIGYQHIKLLGKERLSSDMPPACVLVASRDYEEAAWQYADTKCEDFWHPSYYMEKFQNPTLKQFKNIHCGKRMFVVATGPSLRFEDLACLHEHDELCISVNMVYRAFDRTAWRPNYYVIEDIQALDEYGHEVEKLALPVKFAGDANKDFAKKADVMPNVYRYHLIPPAPYDKWMQVSGDIVYGTYARSTVMCTCMQIAMYMGVKEIYALGMDCSYEGVTKEPSNHFIKDYFSENDAQLGTYYDAEGVFAAMQAINRYARMHGVKIYNATRGGRLEVFERVNFDSLFREHDT